MRYATNVRVDAPPAAVWAVLADVGGWPQWTPTVTAVETGGAGLAVGTTVTVSQPGRRPTAYTVDTLEPGRRFRWSRIAGGVRQWADHVVRPLPGSEGCEVDLTFAMEGPVGGMLGRLGAATIRRMVDTEASSLKARAERSAG